MLAGSISVSICHSCWLLTNSPEIKQTHIQRHQNAGQQTNILNIEKKTYTSNSTLWGPQTNSHLAWHDLWQHSVTENTVLLSTSTRIVRNLGRPNCPSYNSPHSSPLCSFLTSMTSQAYMTSLCALQLYLVATDGPCTDKVQSGDGAAWLNPSCPAAVCKLTEIMWFAHSATTPPLSAAGPVTPSATTRRWIFRKKVARLLGQTTERALSPCARCRKQNWEGKNEKWQDIDLLIATLQTHRSGGWVGGWLSVVLVWWKERKWESDRKDFSTDWFASFWTFLAVCSADRRALLQ